MGLTLGKREILIGIAISLVCLGYKASEYIGYINEKRQWENYVRTMQKNRERLRTGAIENEPKRK
ncbi:hypothetical protein MHSWG343_04200 [Candidatus Mycoplasma haematohominis]|uniref:Uncharacterized protein n=1 Tax=Candidatus Mycoplasma haematohominis TaxID=1494318 RepID=A0A478FPU2_9MOLU|nr:hypothetical protein MHSWG343_04200 [Candidatus Mycoplasma haemohominis]